MWDGFWSGLAWMLIFEGILPLLSPRSWRETFSRVLGLADGQIRFLGLFSLCLGMLGLWWGAR
jgi:uncharacterized protein YjeT (DUF2065 family)